MIKKEEKLIIENSENKLQLKDTFNELSNSMIEYYDLNHLTKKELKHDIQEAWILTMIKAREIDEKVIKEDCLNERNEILKNNQNPNSATSDPADKEKIKELEKEIKDLKETIAKKNKDLLDQNKLKAENKKLIEELKNERINIEKTDIAYLKKHEKLMKLENTHNAKGAGRKPKITKEQIAMIQMLRAQGKKLQEIQTETGISYGNIQKYCKLITDNKKRAGL